VCEELTFQSWHTRNILYLTLAYLRSTKVRYPSYSLSFKSELSVSKSRGFWTWGNRSWDKTVTCVLQVVTVWLHCNVFSSNSEVCENPAEVGRGFSPQLG